MPNRLLLSIALTLCAHFSMAQTWRMGILALNDGEHIIGEIKYDYEENNVQIRYDDKTLAFSAYQFYTFRLVKNDMFPERNFYVLDYAESGSGRGTPHIFEGIYKGDISLLVRASAGTTHRRPDGRNGLDWVHPWFRWPEWQSNFPNQTQMEDIILYEQYIARSDGRVIKLKGGKKERIKAFGAKKSKLTKYVKQNSLNLQKWYDMAKLVKYYNDLLSLSSSSQSQ